MSPTVKFTPPPQGQETVLPTLLVAISPPAADKPGWRWRVQLLAEVRVGETPTLDAAIYAARWATREVVDAVPGYSGLK